jgi:hypothetical protein
MDQGVASAQVPNRKLERPITVRSSAHERPLIEYAAQHVDLPTSSFCRKALAYYILHEMPDLELTPAEREVLMAMGARRRHVSGPKYAIPLKGVVNGYAPLVEPRLPVQFERKEG